MWSLTHLRSHPLFAHVHPLCWAILWWQLSRLCRIIWRDRPDDLLYTVSKQGLIQIHYTAPRTDAAR
jgi:hypothetical protein